MDEWTDEGGRSGGRERERGRGRGGEGNCCSLSPQLLQETER